MKAKARLIKVDHVTGTAKSGKDYDMRIGQFLDLDSFDKIRLMIPDGDFKDVAALVGKDGVLDIGFDARTEKLSFLAFKSVN